MATNNYTEGIGTDTTKRRVSVAKLFRVGFYELQKTIGKGNFAVVKLARNLVTNSKVAIKIIDKSCLTKDNLAKTYREISILKRLRHPHITRLYEVMESDQMLYLVMEYAARGEIFDHLVANLRMKEEEAARVFTQIVHAVSYCHRQGVVHRDLKAENVLLDQDMNVKLADFGFSNTFEPHQMLHTWCGSPPYAAPEVFLGLAYDGPRSDIWSLGIMLYVMTCGALPFDGKTLHDLRAMVLAGKFRIPFFMSQDCENLIRNMLVVDPERRLSLEQISRHRWLTLSTAVPGDVATDHGYQIATIPSQQMDNVVVSHMLKLPQLTFDEIAESVHQQTFNHVFAIYHLLTDKLSSQLQEEKRLQHHLGNTYARRNKRASITTGIVDRSESSATNNASDRLSPLTCAIGNQFVTMHNPGGELEHFYEMETESDNISEADCSHTTHSTPASSPDDPQAHIAELLINQPKLDDDDLRAANYYQATVISSSSTCSSVIASGCAARRHTVGPGDVVYEQTLSSHPHGPMVNFKFGADQLASNDYHNQDPTQLLPINIPTLQNLPLQNFSMKNHLLLKPVMENSTFGRRASDGGANLQIYYPTPSGTSTNTNIISSAVDSTLVNQMESQAFETTSPSVNETNDEINRYMQGHARGNILDEHSSGSAVIEHIDSTSIGGISAGVGVSGASGSRTRRSGLLTVMERPPVISPDLVREVEARMNRNYMPPALKQMQIKKQQHNQQIQLNLRLNSQSMQYPQTSSYTTMPQNCMHHNQPDSSGGCTGCVNQVSYGIPLYGSQSSGGPTYHPIAEMVVSNSDNNGCGMVAPQMVATAPSAALAANVRRFGSRQKLPTVQEIGRYSPVRRASEGSRTQNHGLMQEYQLLQKQLSQPKSLLLNAPPIDNSKSLPGSPIHSGGPKLIEHQKSLYQMLPQPPTQPALFDRDGIKCTAEIMLEHIVPALSMLIHDRKMCPEDANNIIVSRMVPVELLQSIGLTASHFEQAAYSTTHSGLNLTVPENRSMQNIPNIVSPSAAAGGNGMSSPIHQITKGLSGLTTGGGSITRGTSIASDISSEPLDLSMDISANGTLKDMVSPTKTPSWQVPSLFYDPNQMSLSPVQQLRAVCSPPSSPNLCIIQEEILTNPAVVRPMLETTQLTCSGFALSTGVQSSAFNHNNNRPQICLTDVAGSEFTLVPSAHSESDHDSEDSLDGQNSISFQGNIVSSNIAGDHPSITTGVGRKLSLDIDQHHYHSNHHQQHLPTQHQHFENRRDSDKSLAFSDDSLSNDSAQLSPSQDGPSAASSSGFKSGGESHSEETCFDSARVTPDSVLYITSAAASVAAVPTSDECYELPLPYECYNLDAKRILEIVKETIDSKMPPMGFILHQQQQRDTSQMSSYSNESACVHNLSLEYSGGLQIELQVCDGRRSAVSNQAGSQTASGDVSSERLGNMGLKMRRISGDQFEYGKLCQHLISSLTV